MSSPVQPLSQSEVYDLLRNDRRRSVIQHLRTVADVVTVSDLADVVAVSETEESPPPRNIRQSVYVSLQQTHLPRLDEAGVIAFDSERNEVRLRNRADQLFAYLEPTETPVPTTSPNTYRSTTYFGLAVFGVVLVLASVIGFPLFSAVPPVQWSVLSLVAIASIAVYEATRQKRHH